MKFFSKALVGFLVAWSAASLSVQAQGGGATVIMYPSHSGGLLSINGSAPVSYSGGTISGASSVTLFNSSPSGGLTNLGTVTRTGSAPLSLTLNTTSSGSTFGLTAGSTFTSGGTVTLNSGSTVSFGGTLAMGGGLTISSGATLLTNALSYLNSGVTISVGGASTISSTGILQLGTNSFINSDGTLDVGLNSAVTNGVLRVGTGATLDTGGFVTLGAGSTITSTVTPLNTTGLTITGVSTSSGLIVNNVTSGEIFTVANAGSIGTGLVINSTNSVPLTGASLFTGGNVVITGPVTLTIPASGTLSVPLNSITMPVSTQLTINLPAGTAFTAIPAIKGATPSTLGTTATFLGGVDTHGGSVSLLYLPAVQNLAGDALSLHVSEFATPGQNEKFVLQMSFNPTTAAALGNLLNVYLAWYNPANSAWANAVTGNSDGGASAQFIAGAYNPTTDFTLGDYGMDTANSTVWAVIDHDGTFGVANSSVAPNAPATLGTGIQEPSTGPSGGSVAQPLVIPEPSTAALLLCGLSLLGRRRRK